jgi:hypothetical protein
MLAKKRIQGLIERLGLIEEKAGSGAFQDLKGGTGNPGLHIFPDRAIFLRCYDQGGDVDVP